jgi:hypothetical protein
MGAILGAREASTLDGSASPANAFLSGYSTALLIGAAVMLLGALIAWRTFVRPPARADALPQAA